MLLYIAETPLLAARITRTLNLSLPESTVFCTEGLLMAADLRPIREALTEGRSPFIRNIEFKPRGKALIRRRLKHLKQMVSEAKQVFWVSYPSPESELHFRQLASYLNCAPRSTRIICSSGNSKSIRHAALHPVPPSQTLPLYRAAYCRMVADAWLGYIFSFKISRKERSSKNGTQHNEDSRDEQNLYGISFFGAPAGARGRFGQITAGRIQWPVLRWVYLRSNNKVGASVRAYRTHSGHTFTLMNAEKIQDDPVLHFEVLKVLKKSTPDLLYTGDELIKDLIYNYRIDHETAVKLLQQLFEAGHITWPWTTVPFISAVNEEVFKKRIAIWHQELGAQHMGFSVFPKSEHLFQLSAHAREHGIIALSPPDAAELRQVYNIIARRCMNAFTGNSRETSCKMILQVRGTPGYLYGIGSEMGEWEAGLDFKAGPTKQSGCQLPDRNEVITMMAAAGESQGQLNLWTGKSDSSTGLGRPANRSRIIDQLIKNAYLTETDMGLNLTPAGKTLTELFGNSPLMNIEEACTWESRLQKIQHGSLEPAVFLDSWQNLINEQLSMLDLNAPVKKLMRSGGGGYINKATCIGLIRETTCPKCRKGSLETDDQGILHRDCGFAVARSQHGKRLSWNQLRLLCAWGRTHILKGFDAENGKKLRGRVILNEQAKPEFKVC